MIDFFSETDFSLSNTKGISTWIENIINIHDKSLGEIVYVFCDDEYLLKLNQKFLKHDTFTDIISFDNSIGNTIHGEIYISIPRVVENASEYKVPFEAEFHRVIIHGVLHCIGFKDKTETQALKMRQEENRALALLQLN